MSLIYLCDLGINWVRAVMGAWFLIAVLGLKKDSRMMKWVAPLLGGTKTY